MHIKSLTINSYKSFVRPTKLNLSTNFNILIGPNNCGKTNVLDAIDFLLHPDIDPSRLHHHRADIQLVAELNITERQRLSLSTPITYSGKGYAVQVRDWSGLRVAAKSMAYLSQRVKRLHYRDFSDLSQLEKQYGICARVYPEVFSRLTKLLQEYFPEIKSIDRIADAASGSATTISEGRHKSITIKRLGSGFRRVLAILLYALHPDYSVVLIDEPEIHLHPAMIKKVRKVLQAAKANQVIITTHSPLFISASSLHQVYRVLKDDQGSHVYYMAESRATIDKKRLVQELNSDNLEMFFADKVLLVEGVSDRILMRGLIDRFYNGSEEIKVIYTHGKSNIDIYIDLMKVFHIPYLVMLDRDALYMVADNLGMSTGNRHQRKNSGHQSNLIERLKKINIHILQNGTIERNYPRRYQKRDTKPLNALLAAAKITPAEYRSPIMKNIRSIIEQL